ncbi:MAG: L-ribulose-5-phosphate 4-epimerase [Tepidisphaeraceae bacterium]
MPFDQLKQAVFQANLDLVKAGLVVLTWGNASGADRNAGVMAIKPSGVAYDVLKPSDIVVLEIATGKVVDGTARPSSDTPTHLHLYQQFEGINGVVHTHSTCGTSFAQAQRGIPCLGTTHADNFYGEIPCTREMRKEEVETDYELNTGKVIVECFREKKIDPVNVGGVLVASHAPFAWGTSPAKAVENAIVLEFGAQMAMNSFVINPHSKAIPQYLLDKHFLRKHGPKAYYGQP